MFGAQVLLAQALFGKPEALLLDEPTNNLDLESIHWLEEFLKGFQGVLITISHDRHFLNEVCTHIADIDYQTITTYTGNYTKFVEQGEARIQAAEDYTSHNTERLDVAGMKALLMKLDFMRRIAAGEANVTAED